MKIRGDICKSRCTTGVNDGGGKLPPVSTTPAATLPPVSLTPVANNWNNIRLQTPEKNLKAKIYISVSSTTQRWPNKIIKIFWLKIFSICHRCRWHRWQTLSCEYLREFLKKFETVLMEYSGAGGKLILKRTRSKKSHDTVPLSRWSENAAIFTCRRWLHNFSGFRRFFNAFLWSKLPLYSVSEASSENK